MKSKREMTDASSANRNYACAVSEGRQYFVAEQIKLIFHYMEGKNDKQRKK